MARVLIVDDDPSIQTLITALLKTKGHEGVAAESGAKALEMIDKGPFDLIVTDLRMRNMNGLELLREVKVLRPAIPVIMVTAYASGVTTVEAVKLGVFDYLAKPFKVDDLMTVVEGALSAGRDRTRALDGYAGKNPTIKECLAQAAARRRGKKVLES